MSRLGLIAGDGRFPFEVARAVRARGGYVEAIAFEGLSDARLAGEVDNLTWFPLGQVTALLSHLRAAGVDHVGLAGKVPKTFLYANRDALQPDSRALEADTASQSRNPASMPGPAFTARTPTPATLLSAITPRAHWLRWRWI